MKRTNKTAVVVYISVFMWITPLLVGATTDLDFTGSSSFQLRQLDSYVFYAPDAVCDAVVASSTLTWFMSFDNGVTSGNLGPFDKNDCKESEGGWNLEPNWSSFASSEEWYMASNAVPVFGYYALFGSASSWETSTTSTRIISVRPYHKEFIASTTPEFQSGSVDLEFEVYVSDGDYNEDVKLRVLLGMMKVVDAPGLSVSPTVEVHALDLDIPASGFSTLVGSIVLGDTEGRYRLDASIKDSETWLTNFFEYLRLDYFATSLAQGFVSTSTTFTWGGLNDFDEDQDSVEAILSAFDLEKCKINLTNGFDLAGCFTSMMTPNSEYFKTWFTRTFNLISIQFPFGYVTRFIQILTDETSAPLPPLSYTFPSNFGVPLLASKQFSFDWSDIVADAEVIIATESLSDNPQTVWGIMETPIRVFFSLLVFYLIMTDLVGIQLGSAIPSTSRSEGSSLRTVRAITPKGVFTSQIKTNFTSKVRSNRRL